MVSDSEGWFLVYVKKPMLLSALACLLLSASVFGDPLIKEKLLENEKPIVVGVATDLKTNEFLYKEYHYSFESDKRYIVVYRDSGSKVIAEKELLYEKVLSGTDPQLKQNNYLSGEKIDVDTLRAGFRVLVQYRENASDRVESKEFEKPEGLVVDAGFNQLIVDEWSALLKDKTIRFEYLAPSQQRTFTFTARKDSCDAASSNLVNRNNAICFSIAPKSWFMRQLVSPISLVYDSASKRLIRFSGLGNIGNASGDYMEVNIRYEYSDDPQLARF